MPLPVPFPYQRAARLSYVIVGATLLLVTSVAVASAHDFWLLAAGTRAHGSASGDVALRPTSARTPDAPTATSDSSDVVAVVNRFHEALAAGDSAAALSLLANDAVIVESGGVETRAEYRSHHLPGDIGFAQAIKSQRGPMRVVMRGDVAWVSATSVTQGDYRGRPINSAGAELVVLSRESSGWRIRAIHWSSRTRRSS